MALQPDFNLISQSSQTLATQLSLLPNLPTIEDRQTAHDRHAELLRLFRNLDQRFDRMQEQIDRRFNQLQRQQTVVEYNSMMRSLNSSANKATSPIFPLRSPDNVDIPGFPATVEDALGLTGNQISEFLRALALLPTGTVGDRRKRFYVHIGLAYAL